MRRENRLPRKAGRESLEFCSLVAKKGFFSRLFDHETNRLDISA